MKKCKLLVGDLLLEGYSFGAEKNISGEVVFNTGMVGYPETLTDPSYKGQILVLTYPLIGNYGVPGEEEEDGILKYFESDKIQISALVVSDYSNNHNHWNSKRSLGDWLKEYNIPAIYGIDTRLVTKRLREEGVMLGKVLFDGDIDFYDPNKKNLVEEVSVKKPVVYEKGSMRVLVVDCGIKNSIIKSLLQRDVTVIRVPWDYNFNDTMYEYDGILISNGPGDPKNCNDTILNVRKAMQKSIPIFGICLGNQILALASGADTYKLKYGHRSQNQPCVLRDTKKCFITSQNHGYAVDIKTLSKQWEELFVNANDSTNEGIRHKSKPFFSVQFHPEATPGPIDTGFLFDEFIKSLK